MLVVKISRYLHSLSLFFFLWTLGIPFFIPGGPFTSQTLAASSIEIQSDAKSLKIALVHFNVQYKKPEANRKALIELNRQAAEMGAKLILNTEMGISGYSFRSRIDISDFTETDKGKTAVEMARLARQYGIYIVVALAERDPSTEIFYNSALVYGPEGKQICKYRKISAEKRWARPGDPRQDGTFMTPWGRVGIIICSDSYYGLIPRSMALKGVDLLLVSANWPPIGVDPKYLWPARAMENGFFIAGCNRTGMDKAMDCREGSSYVYGPKGRNYFVGKSEESRVFLVDIPLGAAGKIDSRFREAILATRQPNLYRNIYLEPYVEDFTKYHQLPEPGKIKIVGIVPQNGIMDGNGLEEHLKKIHADLPTLILLPKTQASVLTPSEMTLLSKRYNVGICASVYHKGGATDFLMATPEGLKSFVSEEGVEKKELPFRLLHYGPAAVAMVPFEMFRHPELSVTLSKLGCDLVVLSEETFNKDDHLVLKIKTTAGLAVAACSKNSAGTYMIPDVHQAWEEAVIVLPGSNDYIVDTSKTRKKLFQHRIDYDLLLREVALPN